jgi:PTS system nitrogen regulatory IIA component
MALRDALREHRICFLESATKRAALHELVEFLAEGGEVGDAGDLERAVLAREEIMSTGIGLGMAVPHVRIEGVSTPTMAVGFQHRGIQDYDALDGKPVRVIILIVTGPRQHEEYLRLLAELTSKLRDPATRKALFKAKTPAAAYEVLTAAVTEH